MARANDTIGMDAAKPAVTSTDHLDRLLAELRDRKEAARQAVAAKSSPRATSPKPTGANPSPPQTSAPIDISNRPAATRASKPTLAALPDVAQRPPAATATAKAGIASSLRHLPAAVVSRLQALAAGETIPPTPITPSTEAAPKSTAIDAGKNEVKDAILASRPAFISIGMFSLVINLLMLAGPLFMLQVYDRVMTSGSMPTLIVLSVMTASLYAIIGILELVRSRIIVRVGIEVEDRVSARVFGAALRRSLTTQGHSVPALRELDSLRQFIAGPGPITFFDAPWTPVYLAVVFMLHPWLGIAATIGAVILLVIAWASETRSREPLQQASKVAARSLELAETGQRNAEAITAMGMLRAYRTRWQAANGEALAWQVLASDRLGTLTSMSKSLRLLLQSLMLALGAALAIKGEISAGSIVAGTILFGRALAPVEQAIGHWRTLVKAQESYRRLVSLLMSTPEPVARTSLPRPKGKLDVANLRVAAPDTSQLILANLTFSVAPGQVLAVIGPSASGKSTLARTLVGLWPPFSGQVCLDGARLDQWSSEDLGQHVGYLPQDVELFAGTVKENISRFRDGALDDDIVAAAKAAHAHELILALPQGYETQLGNFGTYLSAGQRQRIGLARALYGRPAIIVLDEPNSNLDRSGDEALSSAIDGMRKRGQAAVMISHRVQAIGKADLILYLDRGVQRAFGPRAEVMKLFNNGPLPQPLQPLTGGPSPYTSSTASPSND